MFDNRLKVLREGRGLNMKQAAQKVGIPYTTYVGYEKNEREPNSEVLVLLASFFDCSIDYLLGRDEKKQKVEYEAVTRIKLSDTEVEHIKKYRTLDQYGQDAVTAVLDVECRRCTAQTNEPKLIKVRQAARNGGAPCVTMMTQSELDEIENLPDADPDL